MATGNYTNNSLDKKDIILPFGALLSLLRQQGFSIKPDEYIEVLKVIERFGPDKIEEAGPLICPLIATSPEEQEKFYNVFNQYILQSEQAQNTDEQVIKKKPKKWWILALLAVVLAFLIVYLWPSPVKRTVAADFEFTPRSAFHVLDTLEFSAEKMFTERPADSQQVELFWNVGRSVILGSIKNKIRLVEEGIFEVRLSVSSDSIGVRTQSKVDSIFVCPRVPKVDFLFPSKNPETDEMLVGDSLIVTAGFQENDANFFDKTQWKVNNDTLDANSRTLRLKLDSVGSYSIFLEGISNKAVVQCSKTLYPEKGFNFIVKKKETAVYALQVNQSGEVTAGKRSSKLKNWINWLFMLPALILIVTTLLWWRARKKQKRSKPDPLVIEGNKPPYETPFENKDTQLVNMENVFNQVFRAFRQKAEDEIVTFNVSKTIGNTIRSGGIPEFVFTKSLRYTDYLVLIDQTLSNSQQAKLFTYLTKVFIAEAVTVDHFFFHRNFDKCTNEEYKEGLSLQRLSEMYKQHTLIIMGDGSQLVFPTYPVIDKKVFDVLNEWEYKAILTPVGFKDWGENEELIRQRMVLLPSDISGQLILIQSIREQRLNHQEYLSSVKDFYKTQDVDFESPDELKDYLKDEVLFQWLCAICVFHKIRWEVLVEVGKAVCNAYGQPEKMNYTSLLKLVRIPWMQEGAFPGVTRMELLKKLSKENEIVARETLLHMMEYSATYFGKGYFFEEEKEIQQITSRFLLYTQDKEKYSSYSPDEERFKALWENDQLRDTPQKKYLDKSENDTWSTLIDQEGKNVGLNDYFNRQWLDELRQNRKVLWRNGLVALSLLIVLAFLHIFKNEFASISRLPIVTEDDNIHLVFNLADTVVCPTRSVAAQKIQQASVRLSLPDTIFNIPLEESGAIWTAATDLPSKYVNRGQLEVLWRDGSDDFVTAGVFPDSSTTINIAVAGCKTVLPINRERLGIRYNNTDAYMAVQSQLRSALYGFNIDAVPVDFKTASRIIYYETDQKNRADSIVAIVKQTLGIDVQTEFIPEHRTPPAVPLLFLNQQNGAGKDAKINTLPAMLDEIWKGNTSNRLINISLSTNKIYYSTGDKKTYGTYPIQETYLGSDGTYRILAQADLQYNVFFIRNLQATSFELAVCQNRYDNKVDALNADENACGEFNAMSLYYENTARYIFVPRDGKSYIASERRKMNEYIANKEQLSIRVNSFFSQTPTEASRIARAKRWDLIAENIAGINLRTDLPVEGNNVMTVPSFLGTPFDRDYFGATGMSAPNQANKGPVQQSIISHDGYSIQNNYLYLNGQKVRSIATAGESGVNQPKYIIIYSTAISISRSAPMSFKSNGNLATTHLIIDREGSVAQFESFRLSTYRTGLGSYQGVRNLNKYSISIELVNLGKLQSTRSGYRGIDNSTVPDGDAVRISNDADYTATYWQKFTDQQLNALKAILKLLKETYGIQAIITDSEVNPNKSDPGPAFPLQEVKNEVMGNRSAAY